MYIGTITFYCIFMYVFLYVGNNTPISICKCIHIRGIVSYSKMWKYNNGNEIKLVLNIQQENIRTAECITILSLDRHITWADTISTHASCAVAVHPHCLLSLHIFHENNWENWLNLRHKLVTNVPGKYLFNLILTEISGMAHLPFQIVPRVVTISSHHPQNK